MGRYIDENIFDASAYTIDFVMNNKKYERTVIFPLNLISENNEYQDVKKYLEEVFKCKMDIRNVYWICDLWCPLKYFTFIDNKMLSQ